MTSNLIAASGAGPGTAAGVFVTGERVALVVGRLRLEVEDEETLWEGRYSSKNFLGGRCCGGLFVLTVLALALATWGFGHPDLAFLTYMTGIGVALYCLVLGFKFFRARRNHYYRLTTRRLFLTTGLFQRRVDQVELVRVKDLFVRQSLIGSWLNMGTVILISSEQTLPKAILLGIEEPSACCDLIWQHTQAGTRPTDDRSQCRLVAFESNRSRLIARQAGIDILDPGEDSALEVFQAGESGGLEQSDRLGAADSALAVNDDRGGTVQLAEAIGQLGQGDDRGAGNPADRDFLGVAHVEDERRLLHFEEGLELCRRDLLDGRSIGRRRRRLGAADAAEFLVIDQRVDRRVRPADRALGVLADLHFAEGHLEGVVEQEPADQRFPGSQDEFDRLGRLNDADQARQNSQHAPLGAVGDKVGRRRLGIEAAIAGPVRREKDGRLAVEPEDRAINVGFAQEHAGVVDQVAGGKVVGAVDDHVVAGEQVESVRAVDRVFVADDLQLGVDRLELFLGARDLGPADVAR